MTAAACAAPGCDASATWSIRAVAPWLTVDALPVCTTHRDALLSSLADNADASGLDVSVIPW